MRRAAVWALSCAVLAFPSFARADNTLSVALSAITAPESLSTMREAIASEVHASFEAAGIFRIVRPDVVRAMTRVSPSAACAQQRCAALLGRLVQADYVLIGEMARDGDRVAIALRMIDVRDGTITHRLAFEISPKREVLAREVDVGVRSMLGLAPRRPPGPQERTIAKDYAHADAWTIEVWRARSAAMN